MYRFITANCYPLLEIQIHFFMHKLLASKYLWEETKYYKTYRILCKIIEDPEQTVPLIFTNIARILFEERLNHHNYLG